MDHVLWHCISAKKVWVKVLAWWGLLGRLYVEDISSMWKSCSVFPLSQGRQVWQITLVACIWTLWLERNNLVFTGNGLNEEGIFELVKCRAMEWNIAADYIYIEKSNWWDPNPMGVITASWRHKEEMSVASDSKLVAFIDGSFNSQSSCQFKGGVGGVIKLQDGRRLLQFSGPSGVSSAFEAEEMALFTLLQILQDHLTGYSTITIFLDNQKFVKKYSQQNFKRDLNALEDVCLKFISRNFNAEADALVKQGLSMSTLAVDWD